MSFEADEEILQDFLIEAGEILEEMSEQLVALENDPQDMDLLNGIFRGFHTVKGGAGFLNLKPLVDICHITENIFDILRNGDRVADAELMDNILQSLDLVNEMFDAVRAGEEPQQASPEFLDFLGTFAKPAGEESEEQATDDIDEATVDDSQEDISDDEFDALLDDLEAGKTEQPSAGKNEPAISEDISDDEFEALLDELHGSSPVSVSEAKSKTQSPPPAVSGTENGDITDAEFEALLDELHGDGPISKPEMTPDANKIKMAKPEATKAEESGDISDDEFEALLDELHGKKGQVESKQVTPSSTSTSTSTPSVKSDKAPEDGQIDDSEFEALLDELHGAGKAPATVENKVTKEKATPKPKIKPQKPKPKAKPVAKKSDISDAPKQVKDVKAQATDKPSAPKAKKAAIVTEATVRVDTKRLDDIMNMVGELVLARNRLKTVSASMDNSEDLAKAVSNLDIVTGDLQGAVMKTRMQPIKKVFGRFPRVVRDLARSLKKEITLEMIGEDTDLDKNLVEALADPLVHLVRNSVDHGIEMPEDRVQSGKSRSGTITLSAAQEGDHIMLIIKDDGKGMNADVLRGIAVEKGLMDKEHADRLTDTECYNLIFHAGFSTKKEISDISGRGVGMDVVKTKITQLNGSLDIESELGKGTKILIKVPLTLAILPTLMVKVKEQAFAFPLTAVNEIFHLNLTKTNTVDGQLMIVVREKALPLFFLNELLSLSYNDHKRERQGHVVLAQIGTQTVGFVVDSLVGQEEVVIKPLGKSLQGTPGMAGATITSDGKIALILDIPSLLKHYVS